jgi:hypothetical protein
VVDIVAASPAPAQAYEARIHATAGQHDFGVVLANENIAGDTGARIALVNWFEIEGPYEPVMTSLPSGYRQIMVCDPLVSGQMPCAKQVVEHAASQAYRRPLTDDELAELVDFAAQNLAQGDSFGEAIQATLEAILLSPKFLFRVELEPPTAGAQDVEDHELATRLSYFLWSAPPDDELRALADAHGLSDEAILTAQVDRMLTDPRSQALVSNFADQWLGTRDLADITLDPHLFPAFNLPLRAAMQQEIELTFERILRKNLPISALLDPDFIMVDPPLASLYGLPVVPSNPFDFANLPRPDRRGGLLRMAGFLALTSNPTRTSPTRRGRYVLDRLLCSPPAAPPPNVGTLPDAMTVPGSVRTRMEQHRADPVCAACHAKLDPIGFALENYDAIGQWRTDDNGYAIDPAGAFPDGRSFSKADDLIALVRDDPRLPRCVAEKLLTYGLGRGMTPTDGCALDAITKDALASGGTLRDFVLGVVRSRPFRMRRGEDRPK